MTIINTVGEPDTSLIPTNILPGKLPPELMDLFEFGYSIDRQGLPRTLQAVANNFNRYHNTNIQPNQIIMADGARAGATVAIHYLRKQYKHINPRVLIPRPAYNLYVPQFNDSGFEVDFVDFANADTATRLEHIREALTAETIFFVLTSPNNPTGEIYGKDLLEGILQLLEEFPNLHIINDSVYDRIIIGEKFPHNIFAMAKPLQRKQIFEVSSLAKSYAYPAIRCGWVITDEETAAEMQTMKDPMLGPLNNIAQIVCISALEHTLQNYHQDICRIYTERLKLVHDALSQISGFEPHMPDGAFYYWADFRNMRGTSASDIVTQLAAQGIILAHGKNYGDSNAIRINCAATPEVLKKICIAITGFCKGKHHER